MAATQYYNDAGKKLSEKMVAKLLKAQSKAEAAGKEYTGKQAYTADQISAMYGGYDPSIVAALGGRRAYLTDAPAQYAMRDDAALAKAAEDRYAMTYGLQQTAAANKRDADVLALQQQQAALEPTYTQRLQQSNRQYAQSGDALQGAMTSRGMGRSSYTAALMNNQAIARNQAAGGIEAERNAAYTNLSAQMTAANTAYNSTAEQLAAGKANEMAAYQDQLRQQEFQNQQAAAGARMDYLNALMRLPKKAQKAAKKVTATGTQPTAPKVPGYEDAFGR